MSDICQEVWAVEGGSKPAPLIHLVQNWESRISIFCWISLKSLLVIRAVMYILRPYESKVVGRQLAQSLGNGLFSWNLLRTPWQLTDRRGSQDVLCREECVAQAHSPLQHHRHSDDCSVLNRQNQVCWTAVEACGRLQTVIPSSAYSMANFCVKFRVLITTHSFSSEHRLSHAHLCCLSSWTKKAN